MSWEALESRQTSLSPHFLTRQSVKEGAGPLEAGSLRAVALLPAASAERPGALPR